MTEEEKLIKLYQKAFNDILARVNMSIDAGRFTARDRALLMDLNRILNHLEIEMTQFAYEDLPAMYQAERAKAITMLNEALGTAAIAEQLTMVDDRAIREIQKLFYKGQKDAITAVKKNMNNVVGKLIWIPELHVSRCHKKGVHGLLHGPTASAPSYFMPEDMPPCLLSCLACREPPPGWCSTSCR